MEGSGTNFINIEYFFNKVFDILDAIRSLFVTGEIGEGIISPGLISAYALWKIIASILIILFLFGISYLIVRIRELKKAEQERFQGYFVSELEDAPKNARWEKVVQLFESNNSSDWRLAIIEADTMLEDLVIHLGYDGNTLAERMKKIEPADFPTLQDAWEAHIVRNKIAHEGLDYRLPEREAKRVRLLFEKVFTDARYI